MISSGTSEAYSFLFKTFCDPGDVILTPMPGYPLLDTLANLEYLSCYPYFLDYNEESLSFSLDSQTLLSAPERAKILLLVSPHNPTGHVVSELEWKQIISFCEERSLVLVVDEVFGDYCYDGKPRSGLMTAALCLYSG
jgi:aspartate/methionine/tyrosine aminotransferase